MTESENIKLADAKIGAILNTASGSCSPESLSEIEAIFAEYALTPVKIWCVDSSELSDALDDFKRQNLDVLIILGGDGTIRSAAERCTAAGPYLIPLPGGTMNILPKALYGDLPWKDALRATLQAPQIKDISAGEVAGKRFFISAVCGAPALWAEAREAIREGEYGQALALGKIALENMFDSKARVRSCGGRCESPWRCAPARERCCIWEMAR
jgi:diacylglycerol kinase family enzyme